MIIYFSSTGNTRFVAEELAAKTVQNNGQKGRWGDMVSQGRKNQSHQPPEKSQGENKCSRAFYNNEPETIKEEF